MDKISCSSSATSRYEDEGLILVRGKTIALHGMRGALDTHQFLYYTRANLYLWTKVTKFCRVTFSMGSSDSLEIKKIW